VSSGLRRFLGPALQCAATVLLVGWILRRNDPAAVLGQLRNCHPAWFMAGILLLAVSVLVGTWQWYFLLRAQSVHVPRVRLVRA